MKFLEEHRLAITTLTPVHIGCGEDYTPTDYVIDEDALFAFDNAVVSQALSGRDRATLLKLVQRGTTGILQDLQKFFWEHRQPLMAISNHYLPVSSGVAALYQNRIGWIAAQEEGGRKVINRLEIERTFYNPVSQKPVIPGSSLKGAIRTALLDLINGGKPLSREETQNRNKNRDLQKRLFKFQSGKFEQDPMRLIHLADTEAVKSNATTGKIIFAVNRPRQERVNQHGSAGSGNSPRKPSLVTLLETVPESGLRAFGSRLTIQKVRRIKEKTPDRRWTMEDVAKACNRFYKPLLEKEMAMLRDRGYVSPDWYKRMGGLLTEMEPELDANRVMLLRVGKHSGAEAVTLNGVRNIKIRKGPKPPEYKPLPTTVWLGANTKDQSSEMTPFGWTLIEIDPPNTPPPFLENFADTGQHNDERRQWLEKAGQRIAKAQKELEKRRKQAQEKKENRIIEEKRKQEEVERLATMTDQQRELARLKKLYEEEKGRGQLRAGGQVAESTAKLLIEAPDWPESEDRHAAADLAERIYSEIGWGKGEKGPKRKQKTAKLRDS